jgi:hypothetical protein
VRQEVEKLFALDSHNHKQKPHGFKGHQNSNRWNILRFLEGLKRETILRDGKEDVTAASSCNNSPTIPKFPQLGQHRRNMEDSYGAHTTGSMKTQSPLNSRIGVHGFKKMERRDSGVNGNCDKESQGSFMKGLSSLPIEHSITTDDSSHMSVKGRSRPIPVSRRQVSPTNVMNNEESYIDDSAEENHLKQIYDLRTWEMYIRISEARKRAAKSKMLLDNRSRCISNTTATTAMMHHGPVVPLTHVNSTLPPQCGQHFNMKNSRHMIPFLPKEHVPGEQLAVLSSPASDHEMIFGDLDD